MIIVVQYEEIVWKLRFVVLQYGFVYFCINVIGVYFFEGSQDSIIIECMGCKCFGGILKQGVGYNDSWFRFFFGVLLEGLLGNIVVGVKVVGVGWYVFKICLVYWNINDVSGYEL